MLDVIKIDSSATTNKLNNSASEFYDFAINLEQNIKYPNCMFPLTSASFVRSVHQNQQEIKHFFLKVTVPKSLANEL